MKKFLFNLSAFVLAIIFTVLALFFLMVGSAKAQTNSEIANLTNVAPIAVTVTSATSNNSNLISVDLTSSTTKGYKTITIQITGTWSATVSFQGSQDNFTTVDAIPSYNVTAGTWASSTTANATYSIPCRGYRYIRVRTTAYASGTVAGTAYAKINSDDIPNYNTGTTVTAIVDSTSASRQKVKVQLFQAVTQLPSYGSSTSMTVTNLNSLANSQTAGWQSARVDLTAGYTDVLISVKLTMANTAPANDKAAYVYVVPWYYDGSTWFANTGGVTTVVSGSEGTYTLANPNDFLLGRPINYTTQQQVLQTSFNLSSVFGNTMPSGFSLVIIDYTGAAISGSGNVVQYRLVNNILQ